MNAEVGNLQCVDERCGCLPGYTVNSYRTCFKTYGVACDFLLDCNIDAFLYCSNTTFTCDCQQSDRQLFDLERETCVSLVGFTCNYDPLEEFALHCVEGAYCDMPFVEGVMIHECKCEEEWEEMEDKTCRRRGNQSTTQPSTEQPTDQSTTQTSTDRQTNEPSTNEPTENSSVSLNQKSSLLAHLVLGVIVFNNFA